MVATVKTEKATVAYGRTVRGPGRKLSGPGAEVELPVDEIKELRALGFLVDPTKAAVKRGAGPEFGETRRPTIKRVG